MPVVRVVVFACVAVVVAVGPVAAQPAGDDATRVLAQWEWRRATPAVRYEVRWELFPTNVKAGDPKPGEDGAYTGTGVVLIDAANGRVRADQDERLHLVNRRERLSRFRQTFRYDGREQSAALVLDFAAAAAPAEPVYPSVSVGAWGWSMRWPNEFDPLLWACGFLPPANTPSGPFPEAWRPAPGRFQPTGREAVAGRECVVLRDTAATGATETLWVDAEHGGVVRSRSVSLNRWTSEAEVTYQPTPHGWLPAGWEVRETGPGKPEAVTRRVTVTAVRFDPPAAADDYRIALRPGMVVEQAGVSARVAADGTLEPIARGPEAPSFAARAAALVGWPGLVGLSVAVVLAGGLVAARLRRPLAGVADGTPPSGSGQA